MTTPYEFKKLGLTEHHGRVTIGYCKALRKYTITCPQYNGTSKTLKTARLLATKWSK